MNSGMSLSGTKKLAAGAATLAVAWVACFIAIIGGAAAGDQGSGVGMSLAAMLVQASEACVVGGPVPGLDSQQAANADQVVSSAFAASDENQQVARIALMVAWTESGLRDLGPLPSNDGSLGLFQQRGWGTAEQEMTPTVSTGLFVSRLLALPVWTQLPPWVAAENVQRSRFSDGSNYRVNWPRQASSSTGCSLTETSSAPAVRIDQPASPARWHPVACQPAMPSLPVPGLPTLW